MIKAVIFDCFGVVLDVMRSTRNEAVISLIKDLKQDYRLAMCSNVSGRYSLDQRFKDGELDELFEAVVASGDIGFEKPDPEIYRMTAEKLGVKPEECLFVDDIKEFCEAAERVGMQSAHFVDIDEAIKEIQGQIDNKKETH